MSIQVMSLVWQHYRRGGSEKLALLALADWCDDQGGNLYPSIATIANKVCVSESQARRIIHGFIDDGLLDVVGNHSGGAKSQTRRYRLNLHKLTATPCMDATPSTDATPSAGARDPSHGCASPLAPMTPNPSLTIKEPSKEPSVPDKAKRVRKRIEETLQAFLDRCKAEKATPIPHEDPIFAYINDVGLTEEMLAVAWFVFKSRNLNQDKKQKDWRAHYRNAVRSNWFKLWFFGGDGTAGLTTAGQQAQREMEARTREAQA